MRNARSDWLVLRPFLAFYVWLALTVVASGFALLNLWFVFYFLSRGLVGELGLQSATLVARPLLFALIGVLGAIATVRALRLTLSRMRAQST